MPRGMNQDRGTVPQKISTEIQSFCRTISSSDPVFVQSIPIQRAKQSHCFDNVERKIAKSGGSVCFGWAIWHQPSLYFEAEHHAVWRNKYGKLIDVSPQHGKSRRMLFLPDEEATYDPFSPRQNIVKPDGNSARAVEIAALGNQRHSLLMRCRVPGTAEIQLFPADQVELEKIQQRIDVLMQL